MLRTLLLTALLGTYINNAGTIDPRNGKQVYVTRTEQQITAEPHRLFGGIPGPSIDATEWATAVAGSGTVTNGNELFNLTTGTTANSNAQINSIHRIRYVNGQTHEYIAGVQFGDTGVANNVRRVGVGDANNGLFFVLNQTTFQVCHRNTGVDSCVNNGSFNSTASVTLDTNFHVLFIRWTSGTAEFYYDNTLLQVYTTPTTGIVDLFNLQILAQNINSAGSTTNTTLAIRGQSVYRLGDLVNQVRWVHLSAAGTTVIRSTTGKLIQVLVNNKGAGGTTLTLYDNTAGSGTVIAVIDCSVSGSFYQYDLVYDTGLTAVLSNTADVTITFDN